MNTIGCLFAGATPPAGAGANGQPATPGWFNLFPIILMFVVFYFLLIRPQSKRQKEVAQMQKSLKSGMKVVTASGIMGTIITVKDKSVTLRSADSKFEISRSAISEVFEKADDETPENEAPPVKKA
jgi:preprotein translocase subunit YajC